MSLTNCRFYEEKYPEIDSFVMVNVKQIAEMGAYVKLLEYDNIDGMILLSELSRRRIRSIQKLIRVGRNEVVVVLRVDKEKGYIDLSKRRVSPEDIVKCEERYNKSKMVHSIMRHVAEKTSHPIEDLYERIGWPLNKKYGHAVDAFKLSITNPDVWQDIAFPNDVVSEELKSYIGKRLTPQPTKVRADVEVTCFGYEGIDAVKTALRTAEARNTPDNQVKVKLVSPPLYVLTSTCLEKAVGIQTLEAAIVDIRKNIEAANGNCIVKMEPKAVTENDDAELQALMEKRERENAEVSGDENPQIFKADVNRTTFGVAIMASNRIFSAFSRLTKSGQFFRSFSYKLFIFGTWIPAVIFFNDHVGEVTRINGASMYPYLNTGFNESNKKDLCWVNKMSPTKHLQRGMLVSFWSPYHPDVLAIKRVIAVEGDRVVTRAPYPITIADVPAGHIWVEGDNRDGNKTLDSNHYGPIPLNLVQGKITHVLWPWSSFGAIRWWEFKGRTRVLRGRKETALQWD
ncbi:hypothetical protein G7Y89_g5847 [Cudoniella acicularis]|uniref:Eukaryotic translation initiation factor 2 subunit alpha n=1 Tax=Cudoniella acicularis TaxID=354080 RepID=A0A8H4RLP5_9HELO|nr:hypothetical protein G7Y89_g5847 [Cudoniella acicularis]